MNDFTDKQRDVLKDLLREKSFWQVYKTSLRIPFSRLNILAGILVGVVVANFGMHSGSPAGLADQLLVFSTMAFSLSIGQLGFLLAGFSFFATIADREMFCRMAEKTHSDSGLSYLKYNFFVFMRVFVEYLVFALVCLGLMVILTKSIGIRETISARLSGWPTVKHLIAAGAFGAFISCIVYLLLQLASFIYNILHVVMTSIRWALQKDYERQSTEVTQRLKKLEEPSGVASGNQSNPNANEIGQASVE